MYIYFSSLSLYYAHMVILSYPYTDQLDKCYISLRNGCRDDRLSLAVRYRLLEVIELRAMHWQPNENLINYYKQKLVQIEVRFKYLYSSLFYYPSLPPCSSLFLPSFPLLLFPSPSLPILFPPLSFPSFTLSSPPLPFPYFFLPFSPFPYSSPLSLPSFTLSSPLSSFP